MTNSAPCNNPNIERAYQLMQDLERELLAQRDQVQARLKLVRTSLSKLGEILQPAGQLQAPEPGARSLLTQLEQMLRQASCGLTRAEIVNRLAHSAFASRSVNLPALISNRLSSHPERFVRDAATRRWFHVDCVRGLRTIEPIASAAQDGSGEHCAAPAAAVAQDLQTGATAPNDAQAITVLSTSTTPP